MRLTCVALRPRVVDETNQCAVYDQVVATMPRRFRAGGAPFIQVPLEEHLERELGAWLDCTVEVEQTTLRVLAVVPSAKWAAVVADIATVAGMLPGTFPDVLVVASDVTPEDVLSAQSPVGDKPERRWVTPDVVESERSLLAGIRSIVARWGVNGAPRLLYPVFGHVTFVVPSSTPDGAVDEVDSWVSTRLPIWLAWSVERGV